eukprot:jgi/Psemu1/290160/fgenesh1_pg.458_\
MTGHEELVAQAEHAARKTIRAWIRRALRESFLQGIRQVWTVRPRDDDDDDQRDGGAGGSAGAGAGNDDSCYKVELSASGLRACFGLVERHEINDSVMSVSDALRELRSNNDNDDGHHPTTHWPLGNEIIDRAAVELSHRMRARDRHGSGGGSSNSGAVRNGVDADGNVYYTKKTVRFKVVPKSTATTSTVTSAATAAVGRERDGSDDHDHDHDDEKDAGQTLMTTTTTLSTIAEGGDEPSRIAALMLASRKRKGTKGSSSLQSQSARKKARASFLLPWDVPRPPCDAALPYVGQTNHLVKNKTTTTTTTNIGLPFLSKENTNKIARRKERVSIQERLDPNRIQAGRGENPVDRNSKFLRTEDWFDERKKFFDFDLGWSLLEIPAGRDGDQKKLCAFSSLEVCLGDHD